MQRNIFRIPAALAVFMMLFVTAMPSQAQASRICHTSKYQKQVYIQRGHGYHQRRKLPKYCGLCYVKHHPSVCTFGRGAHRRHYSGHGHGHSHSNVRGKLVIIF